VIAATTPTTAMAMATTGGVTTPIPMDRARRAVRYWVAQGQVREDVSAA
jgi:hypothetical protein